MGNTKPQGTPTLSWASAKDPEDETKTVHVGMGDDCSYIVQQDGADGTWSWIQTMDDVAIDVRVGFINKDKAIEDAERDFRFGPDTGSGV